MRKVAQAFIVGMWFLLLCSGGQVLAQVATFAPQDPKIGEVVNVVYNPAAQGATILNPTTLTLQALALPQSGVTPLLMEIPLERNGNVWQGNFTFDRKESRFVLYRFISGDLKDDNGEQGWGGMLLASDGQELEGTRYWRGIVLAFGGYQGFKYRKDVEAAKADIAKERVAFPDEYSAVNISWYLQTNPTPTEAGIAAVKKEIPSVLEHFRKNEDALPMILVWMEQTGLVATADSLRSVLIAENPKGKVASVSRMREISKEKDPIKRSALFEQYVADLPMKGEELLANQRELLMGFIQIAQYEKGYALLKSAPKLDPGLYRTLTSVMIESEAKMDKAVEWLAEGIAIARAQGEEARPPYVSKADWIKNQANTLAGLLTVRGVGLLKLKRYPEAETLLLEAYQMKHGEDLIANENLIKACVANSKFKEAELLGLECIRKAKSNLNIVNKFKEAYKEVHGSLNGYDKVVKDAKVQEEISLLKRGLNKPSPDFSLKDMTGAIVKLSSLKGKVVVLDFWATWCAPCKVSLPNLQKVYERYEGYRTVAVLGVNTAEKSQGFAREAAVKKYITEGKYTFPIVYDNGYATAQRYSVEGIPTRVIIDRSGKIQFVNVGISNDADMVNDLITQIETLLKH